MHRGASLPADLRHELESNGVDVELTLSILEKFNAGRYDSVRPVVVRDLPTVDGRTVVELSSKLVWRMPLREAEQGLSRFPELGLVAAHFGSVEGAEIAFTHRQLQRLGLRLLPLAAYGILNGGSATSYADLKKNSAFSAGVLAASQPHFDLVADEVRGRSKGLTPAFLHPDGTPGPSYIELKMRAALIQILAYRTLVEPGGEPRGSVLAPLFQMTSVNNNDEVLAAYERFRESPLLVELMAATGVEITRVLTGVQPLIAAYTHSSLGRPKRLFTEAYGKPGAVLPLPGGHGQNFAVMKEHYRALFEQGKRFVQLGNVDNIGNTLDPVELALLALSGRQAGFDFAFRTPVDVKGGILVVEESGRLDCADIGPAISPEEVHHAESLGKRILFNCATGLFDLGYLTSHIDAIIDELPMRWSDQDKDAGRYSQAEQVTWEIIGLLDRFFIFGVDKYERFLAAKLLLECLMTSGIGLDDPRYPTDPDPAKDLHGIATALHAGLTRKLSSVYGLRREGRRWVPKSVAELVAELE